jgi:hypothetical protein
MADLITGEVAPTRERAAALLEELAGAADRVGCAAELALAASGLDANGAARQRSVAGPGGEARAVAPWLAGRFLG